MDSETCYKALLARDRRYDGHFFTAVLTTGIFCRPVCPARPPRFENCRFMPSAAAAQAAGFRPCLRCRPELSPSLPGWHGTSTTVRKALRYIAQGFLNDNSVPQLAERLGIGDRHFRRLFQKHMGTSARNVALTRRLLIAKQLLTESDLTITQVAHAAGFQSIRRFNDTLKRNFRLTPQDIRKKLRTEDPSPGPAPSPDLTLTLAYTPPYDWDGILRYLAPRLIPGVESIADGRYSRSFVLDGKPGSFTVAASPDQNKLKVTIRTADVGHLPLILSRVRDIFDLDANVAVITRQLATHPDLAWRINSRPGTRVIGAWDPFELTVRAILGQQVTVAGATTLIGRLVARHGPTVDFSVPELDHIFPSAAILAEADLSGLGITGRRIATLNKLAATVRDDPAFFHRHRNLDDFIARMCTLPGIGEWTAHYVAMRALRDADAFPASDLVLLKQMQKTDLRPTPKQLTEIAEDWRPWRAYAAMYLWATVGHDPHQETTDDTHSLDS